MMQLIKHNNHMLPSRFSSLFDSFFDDFVQRDATSIISTSVDISEDDKEYHVEMALPGFDKKDINVELVENMLRISGERKFEKKDEKNYHRIEISYGSFERSFQLPDTVDSEKIEAEFKNGILFVSIKKKKESLFKRLISIK